MTILRAQDPITEEVVEAIEGALAVIARMRRCTAMQRRSGTAAPQHRRARQRLDRRAVVLVERHRPHAVADPRSEPRSTGASGSATARGSRDGAPAGGHCDRSTGSPTKSWSGSRTRAGTGAWDRRGMVVGQVQSGKTAQLHGPDLQGGGRGLQVHRRARRACTTACAARRRSASTRASSAWTPSTALLHKDGREPPDRRRRDGQNAPLLPINSITNSEPKGDFKRPVAQQVAPTSARTQCVLVVKKNKTILKNLIEWVTRETGSRPGHRPRGRRAPVPLLVIDDEADNASVNTKEVERELDDDGALVSETDPATINRLIRKLLHSFEQSAYVGYTATPFANIFIYDDERTVTVRGGPVSAIVHRPDPAAVELRRARAGLRRARRRGTRRRRRRPAAGDP